MSYSMIRLTFEESYQAGWALGAVREVVDDYCDGAALTLPDEQSITLEHFDQLQDTSVDDEQGFFMRLCFHVARECAETSFTGICCMGDEDGVLTEERVFYDGYMLGSKCLEGCQQEPTEHEWHEVGWRLWMPVHGHFVDLDVWRKSRDYSLRQ